MESNPYIKKIRNAIELGKVYTIIRPIDEGCTFHKKDFKIVYKDNIKFIGEMACGPKEAFLYQSVFCKDIVIKEGDKLLFDVEESFIENRSRNKARRPWTREHDKILIENSHLPDRALAERLGRTETAIANRRQVLKKRRKKKKKL